MILDVISAALILLGGVLSLAAAVGLLRFADLLSRMHASAKPQVLGLLVVAVAIAIQYPNWSTVTTLAIIISFQLVTIPVATHMVGRAGYRTKHLRRSMLYRDELAEAVDRAEARDVAWERRKGIGTDHNDG
ncbi:MAG: monovalent cation/H(+) antiporter subunit G [Brevibacterium sp.]|uniref:monovalent cation/H(+) antiporter subunit G n=1 Tax=Brevibacterium sp. TaxID=1701 RepID=UPI002648EDFE|nr:monovalent cation/H(+) antiporter subunit G [Brevibacterium sp.]MDN5806713.1 monovalent cation/H(+) antiporter subunit G [Brevibacterium sp.]MDN5832484.1 monovalent cation/H(+) antiporter subunit G [Brevibacterium sp.]MDN5908265.1 monovalent cation/H(+) antiporter subunit G [Brevibacterium sp.]MDN6122565.1 monovalent cation/H(+) antiporter subunit G [Brevibacterium sp.]MDN6132785.1 monovalent cation/H(+) antiporter subunit G [Brevibacterium sp.]